ncbi:hypothetical protein HN451_01070 [archaeon]|nr:hypothetical protein [archaeon]
MGIKKMTNIEVDNDVGEVKLVLDTKFYGSDAIMKTAKEYLDSCWVFLDGDVQDKLLVTLKPKSKEIDINTLGYEFCNYILGLMQNEIF